MNLEELQSVRDRERRTDKLQELRESFYADAGEFIQSLREQRERAAERAEDPFDAPEVNRLSDEIDTAEQTVEAIYEKRVGKIVKAASFAAADLPAGSEGMTTEEQDLFEKLVTEIENNREHVLDVLAGNAGGSGEVDAGHSPPTSTDEPTDASMDAADVMGSESVSESASTTGSDAAGRGAPSQNARRDGAGTPPDATAETPAGDAGRTSEGEESTAESIGHHGGVRGHERETVRITADVGTILGVDEREYDLSETDVVQLPATNANALVERDAAERIDYTDGRKP